VEEEAVAVVVVEEGVGVVEASGCCRIVIGVN